VPLQGRRRTKGVPSLQLRYACMSIAWDPLAQLRNNTPSRGAVVTLLAVCGTTHRESYFDIVIVAIVGALIALTAVIAIGSIFGSFWTRFEEPDRRLLVGDAYAMCPSGT
jgi:hypothetical protein